MSAIEEVWNRLIDLTKADRDVLLSRITATFLRAAEKKEDPVEVELAGVLRSLDSSFPPPFALTRISKRARLRWQDGLRVLEEMLQVLRVPSRGVRRLQALRVLSGLVLEDLRTRGIPVGPETLGHGLCRIWSIMDAAFPGYLKAGVVPWNPVGERKRNP
jgi:hypothetical protein